NGKDQVYLLDVEPYKPNVVIADDRADLQFPRMSPDGNHIVYQARLSDGSIELRVTDENNKSTRAIYKSGSGLPPQYLLSPAWSPDSRRVIFDSFAVGNSDIYSVNADGGDLKRVTDDPLPDLSPV